MLADRRRAASIAVPLIDPEADSQPPPLAPPRRGRAAALWLGLCLMLVAGNLRLAITSVGPVLADIIRDERLSVAAASWLTTLPSLCFGIFGLLAPALGRRFGTERALLGGLLALAAGTALRGVAAVPALFGGQAVACLGIALINVLLPGLVKRDFPARVALMTGLYTTALCGVAALGAALTVPLERRFADAGAHAQAWAPALACWAAPALAAALCWLTVLPRRVRLAHAGHRVRGLWRDAVAWQVTLFMGLQSALAYIMLGWLATMLRERGLSALDAGLMLALSVMTQVVGALLAPVLATRGRDQRPMLCGALALSMVGIAGCVFAPLPAIATFAVLLGIAQGALLALALTLLALRAPDAIVAAELSGMAQGVGYVLAASGPLLAGLLRSRTGGWGAVAALCLAITLAAAWAGWGAGRTRHVGVSVVPAVA